MIFKLVRCFDLKRNGDECNMLVAVAMIGKEQSDSNKK